MNCNEPISPFSKWILLDIVQKLYMVNIRSNIMWKRYLQRKKLLWNLFNKLRDVNRKFLRNIFLRLKSRELMFGIERFFYEKKLQFGYFTKKNDYTKVKVYIKKINVLKLSFMSLILFLNRQLTVFLYENIIYNQRGINHSAIHFNPLLYSSVSL